MSILDLLHPAHPENILTAFSEPARCWQTVTRFYFHSKLPRTMGLWVAYRGWFTGIVLCDTESQRVGQSSPQQKQVLQVKIRKPLFMMELIPRMWVWCTWTVRVCTRTQDYSSRDVTTSKPKWTKEGEVPRTWKKRASYRAALRGKVTFCQGTQPVWSKLTGRAPKG